MLYNRLLDYKDVNNTDKAGIYYNIGNIYFLKDEYNLAIENYKAALLLNPEDEEIKYNIEYLYRITKKMEDPISLLEEREQNVENQKEILNKREENLNKQISKIQQAEVDFSYKDKNIAEKLNKINSENKEYLNKELQQLLKEKANVEQQKKQVDSKISNQENNPFSKYLDDNQNNEYSGFNTNLNSNQNQNQSQSQNQNNGNTSPNSNNSNQTNSMSDLAQKKKQLQEKLNEEVETTNKKIEQLEQIETNIVQEVVRPEQVVNPKKIIDRYIKPDGLIHDTDETHFLIEREKELIFRDVFLGEQKHNVEENFVEQKHELVYNDPNSVGEINGKPSKYIYEHEDLENGQNAQSKYKVKETIDNEEIKKDNQHQQDQQQNQQQNNQQNEKKRKKKSYHHEDGQQKTEKHQQIYIDGATFGFVHNGNIRTLYFSAKMDGKF